MKRVFGSLVASLALVSVWADGGDEPTLDSLRSQRAGLAVERKDAETKLKNRRQDLEKSKDMAAANADVDRAVRALDKALADDQELRAARVKAVEARRGLEAAIAGAADVSDDAKALDVQRGELEAKRAERQFQSRLLGLQLNHGSSPARAEAESDAAVKKARMSYAEAEADMRGKPTPAVEAAAKDVDAARQKDFEVWRKLVSENRELKAATQEEQAARDAMLKAQSDDKRKADLAAARKALEEVRDVSYRAQAAAKPLLAEVAKIEKEIAAVERDRRAANEMQGMFRDGVREGNDRNVVKAREALAAAEKAFDAACPADVRNLGVARKEAWNAYEAKRSEVRDPQAEKDAIAKKAAIEKDIEQLKEKLLAGKSVLKDMTASLKARIDIDQKLREKDEVPKSKEAQAQAEEVARLRNVFSGAKAQHLARVESVPLIKQTYEALNAAKSDLAAAVELCLVSHPEAQPVRSLIDDLAALRRGQDYRLAVLMFRLHDSMSPIAQIVAQHPDVAAAAVKVGEIEKAIREEPLVSCVKAEKALGDARAAREKIENELRKDPSYVKAVQARQAAEKALQVARDSDARGKVVAEARMAAERLVAEKMRTVASGASIAADIEKVHRDIAEVEKAIRGVAEKKNELRRAAEKGENPKIALAKKAVADADAAALAAEQSEKIVAMRKAVDDARKARDARLKEVSDKDKEYAERMDELSVVAQLEKSLSQQIMAKEKSLQTASKNDSATRVAPAVPTPAK